MGPKEAWLNVVLSYDRIKSVYKYTELQKARENFCVSLRSVSVLTCIKLIASSKTLNEVSVKMWHRAYWCFLKKAPEVSHFSKSLRWEITNNSELASAGSCQPLHLVSFAYSSSHPAFSSVYIDEQLINAGDYGRLRCSHWFFCEAKSFSSISEYTTVLISVLVSRCSSLLLSTLNEYYARKKHLYATVSSSAGCCSAAWPFLLEEVSHQVLMFPAWRVFPYHGMSPRLACFILVLKCFEFRTPL